jgi:hypothetical protein
MAIKRLDRLLEPPMAAAAPWACTAADGVLARVQDDQEPPCHPFTPPAPADWSYEGTAEGLGEERQGLGNC